MEIQPNLPLPAYYALCDKIEDRINHFEFNCEHRISSDEALILRKELILVRTLIWNLEKRKDNCKRIMDDLEKIKEILRSM